MFVLNCKYYELPYPRTEHSHPLVSMLVLVVFGPLVGYLFGKNKDVLFDFEIY